MNARLALALPLTLVGAAFVPLASWFAARWQAQDGFFSHGPLVPFAAAWLLWSRRAALAAAGRTGSGDWRGALPALAALLGVGFACFLRVDSPAAFALLGLAAGVVWMARGAALLRALALPLSFLAFAVPWPMELVADAVQSLKLLVIAGSSALLAPFATGVAVEGSYLVLRSGERLLVDDECSGLSSAIALLALGAFMAASARRLPVARRLLLFAGALPIALVANLARVIALALIGVARGAAAVERWHDATNALVYVVALVAFVLAERWLTPAAAAADAPVVAPSAPPAAVAPVRRGPALVACAFALLALGATVWLRAPVAAAAAIRVVGLPQAQDGWVGVDVPLSERQYRLLETRDVLLRSYVRDGEKVLACIAVAGVEQKAAHPPAICYRGQGFSIEEQSAWCADLGGRERPFEELVVAQGDERWLVWSWYRVGAEETESWWREQWLALRARLARRDEPAALLRFSTPLAAIGAEEREAGRRRLARFLGTFLPLADHALAPALRAGESPGHR